jgi:hypothetical protein
VEERKVYNQKQQIRRVTKRARKVGTLVTATLEEKNERLVLLHTKPNAHEAAKLNA